MTPLFDPRIFDPNIFDTVTVVISPTGGGGRIYPIFPKKPIKIRVRKDKLKRLLELLKLLELIDFLDDVEDLSLSQLQALIDAETNLETIKALLRIVKKRLDKLQSEKLKRNPKLVEWFLKKMKEVKSREQEKK